MNEANDQACGLDDKTQRAIDIIEENSPASESDGMDEYQRAAYTLCDKVRELSAKLKKAGGKQPEATPNAGGIASSLQRVVRCCATCADWNTTRMECRYEQNVPAGPMASCSGWRENLNTNTHWHEWAKAEASNNRIPNSDDTNHPC